MLLKKYNYLHLLFLTILLSLSIHLTTTNIHANTINTSLQFDTTTVNLKEGNDNDGALTKSYKIRLTNSPAQGDTVNIRLNFPDPNGHEVRSRYGDYNEYNRLLCPDGLQARDGMGANTKVYYTEASGLSSFVLVYSKPKSKSWGWYLQNKSGQWVDENGQTVSEPVHINPYAETFGFGVDQNILKVEYVYKTLPDDNNVHSCFNGGIAPLTFNSNNWNEWQTIRLRAGRDTDFANHSFNIHHSTHVTAARNSKIPKTKVTGNKNIRVNIEDRQMRHRQTTSKNGHTSILENSRWESSPQSPDVHLRERISSVRNDYQYEYPKQTGVQTMTVGSIRTLCFNSDIMPINPGLFEISTSNSNIQFVDDPTNPTSRSGYIEINFDRDNWDIYSTENGSTTCLHIEASSVGDTILKLLAPDMLRITEDFNKEWIFKILAADGQTQDELQQDQQADSDNMDSGNTPSSSDDMYTDRTQGDMSITVSSIDDNSFTASWDNTTYNSPGFEVYYWIKNDKENTIEKIVTTSTQVDITNLEASTIYVIEVHYIINRAIYYSQQKEVVTLQAGVISQQDSTALLAPPPPTCQDNQILIGNSCVDVLPSMQSEDTISRTVSITGNTVAKEHDGTMTINLLLNQAPSNGEEVIVHYRLLGTETPNLNSHFVQPCYSRIPTATIGEDYRHNPQTEYRVVFKAGQTTARIIVPIVADNFGEDDEFFYIELLPDNIVGAKLAGDNSACDGRYVQLAKIINSGAPKNDITKSPYVVTVTPFTGTYSSNPGRVILDESSGTTNVKFRIALRSGTANGDQSYTFIVGGSAITGTDYTSSAVSNNRINATIPDGASHVDITIPITVIDDKKFEIEEEFEYISLLVARSIDASSESKGATLYYVTELAQVYIRDNDDINTASAKLQAYQGSYVDSNHKLSFSESAGTVNFKIRVNLDNGFSIDHQDIWTVLNIGDDDYNYLSSNSLNIGTATEGIDYATINDVDLFIGLGESYVEYDISLTITDDNIKENTETIVLNAELVSLNNLQITTYINIIDND